MGKFLPEPANTKCTSLLGMYSRSNQHAPFSAPPGSPYQSRCSKKCVHGITGSKVEQSGQPNLPWPGMQISILRLPFLAARRTLGFCTFVVGSFFFFNKKKHICLFPFLELILHYEVFSSSINASSIMILRRPQTVQA